VTNTFEATSRPTNSPWGGIQHADELGPGVWSVSTSSHGGIHLSDQRLALIPDYMRGDGSWFEEDCDWAVVATVFPDLFTPEALAAAADTFRHWRPDAYEQFTGKTLQPGDSFVRDRDDWARTNAGRYATASAFNSGFAWVDDGYVGVVARPVTPRGCRNERGIDRCYLVPEAEYSAGPNAFLIDPARHRELRVPANLGQRKPWHGTTSVLYDPAKLTINRKRFSVTQGEVELVYDGVRLEQYGDKITLVGKDYVGHSDAF